MKQGVALADVALASAGAENHLVATVDGRALQHADWVRKVRGWHAAFARVSGDEVAFYFEDALEFPPRSGAPGMRARRPFCSAMCSLQRWSNCCPL